MAADRELRVIRQKILPEWLRVKHLDPSAGKITSIHIPEFGPSVVVVSAEMKDGRMVQKSAPFEGAASGYALLRSIATAAYSAVATIKREAAEESWNRMVIDPAEWTVAA